MQEIILSNNDDTVEILDQISQYKSIEQQVRLSGRPDLIIRLDQIVAMKNPEDQYAALEAVIAAFNHL